MSMAKLPIGGERDQILEVGGRIIFEWRNKRSTWSGAAPETRIAYRARMQELLNVLAHAGYEVRR